MKKGYVITIVCLLLALAVLGTLIYFDLFRNDNAEQKPLDMTQFEQAMQEIEDSRTIGSHLWILTDPDGEPTLFRYDKPLVFTAEILKENKAALLHTTLTTEYVTHAGYYELYYDGGWKLELTDGKPAMFVEKTTHHYENMNAIDVTFRVADRDVHPTAAQLEAAKTSIEKRLVAKNILDYEAYIDPTNGEILLRFPWADTSAAGVRDILAELSQVGMVQFYDGEGNTNADGHATPPAASKLILDGSDIKTATAMVNQDPASASSSPYVVALELTDAGTQKFSAATRKLAPTRGVISIWLDYGETWAKANYQPRYALLSAPTVENHITNGKAIITGFTSYEDAKEIADLITAGALPFDIEDAHVSLIKMYKYPPAQPEGHLQ